MIVYIHTLGCKVNQYESSVMSELFKKHGYEVAGSDENADIYVINSCTVTSYSDKKTRQAIGRFRRINPNAVIALTGCMPQAFPEKAARIDVDIIMGTAGRNFIIEAVENFMLTKQKSVNIIPHTGTESFEKMQLSDTPRARAYIKIQDGCNMFCSYCIIPTARGAPRSRRLSDIQIELEQLAANGHKEIVLTGINLALYGQDLGLRLIDAVRLACTVGGIERVRLSSLEPELLCNDDIEWFKNLKQLCPHFHLSLQSGCDETLRRMNRRYDTAKFRSIVNSLREKENTAITTDIMVGFAGETDEEFGKTLDFVESIGFADAHVFSFSQRNGTKAVDFPNQVPDEIKTKRNKTMAELVKKSKDEFLRKQIGLTYPVLIETVNDGTAQGHTPNYLMVKVYNCTGTRNQTINTKITGIEDGTLISDEKS